MKKTLLNLALLLVAALGLILLLTRRSDPDKKKILFTRDYARFTLMPAGKISFPGKVSLIKMVKGNVYGYVHKLETVFRYDPGASRLDTFIRFASFGAGALNGFDIDPVSGECYGFTALGKEIMHFAPDGRLIDSVVCTNNPYVKGIKDFTGNAFFIKAYDPVRVNSLLKRAEYGNHHSDTLIYTFPHFDDGGISGDGSFVRQPGTGDLFFIPFYNASVIQFDGMRNRVSSIVTVDSTPPFNIAIHTTLGYMISSKAILLNSTATADSSSLYVLSYAQDGGGSAARTKAGIGLGGTGKEKVAIDIYSTSDGKYEGSVSLDAPPSGAVLSMDKSGDTLLVSSTNNVLLFKLIRK